VATPGAAALVRGTGIVERSWVMTGKVFFSVSMSLDGFIAPASMEDLMGPQWMELQQWIFRQRFFRENLKLGEGGEEGHDNDIVRETFERTGASVMGKRMFDAGEPAWPEDPPFHTPVFVVTHERREPWERLGGTTFHFVNDGIEAPSTWPARPPVTGMSASRAAARRSCST
jgi:dihydrofolate reductase